MPEGPEKNKLSDQYEKALEALRVLSNDKLRKKYDKDNGF